VGDKEGMHVYHINLQGFGQAQEAVGTTMAESGWTDVTVQGVLPPDYIMDKVS
jgi:hypothetical protein